MKYIYLLVCLVGFSFVQADQSYEAVSNKLNHLIEKVEGHTMNVADALLLIDEKDIDILLKPSVQNTEKGTCVAKALGVCSGAVQGVLCFNLNELAQLKNEYGSVIWVTDHIRNDDLCHLKDIAGIFAFKEDPSSHAVIVTRVFNIPCLTLPEGIEANKKAIISEFGSLEQGDLVTLDAFNGKLFSGAVPLVYPKETILLNKIMSWSEEHAKLIVHGNADTAEESQEALLRGAKGVDPRTEHMFFHPDALRLFRKIIVSQANDPVSLQELENLQREDFVKLYTIMKSYPVKIRLLDPPLHEFLPTEESSLNELAIELDMSLPELKEMVKKLQEVNPMMGHRGVRLLLTHPQILKMQIRAIFEAATEPSLQEWNIEPDICIPMIISYKEVVLVKKWIEEVREEVSTKRGRDIKYHLGIMLETPRACLLVEEITPYIDFVAFGSNDLTGQTLALSRGDVYEKFLKFYFDSDLLSSDPFVALDPAVCALMKIAIDKIRLQDHYISIGLCGEQGGWKEGVFMCHRLGLDTVSCASSRIPSVMLFAAQAAILDK